MDNSSWADIDITGNCNDENVNILCSLGFFDLVARPTLLGISPNHQVTYGGIIFELRSMVHQRDQDGVIQSTILKYQYQ